MRQYLLGGLLSLLAAHASAVPLVLGSSNEWREAAAGFTVTDGRITHIEADLTVRPGAGGYFVIGIATNELIGNPSLTYGEGPRGSVWQTKVCSTVPAPGEVQSSCDRAGGGRLVELDPGETFAADLDLGVYAGTYWLYTWFVQDSVTVDWEQTNTTGLVARRQGICTGQSNGCTNPLHLTFFQSQGDPGLRMDYRLEAPEPGSLALAGVAVAAVALTRRRHVTPPSR